MNSFRFFKRNIFTIIIVAVIIFLGVRVFLNQEKCLDSIAVQRMEKEAELELAKFEFEKISELEKISNTSESKENQIRERLNMIKKDEIQFLFSKEE